MDTVTPKITFKFGGDDYDNEIVDYFPGGKVNFK